MKDYLIKLGKREKEASIESVTSKKKDKVLQDYCNLIFINQSNIVRENKKDLRQAKSKKLKNLFYTGQLTVPGPGVPPSLISGKVVANYILNKELC